MRKLLHFLYQPWKWLIYIPFLGISTIVFGFSAVLLAFLINARVASFIGGVIWARLNALFTPIIVKKSGKKNIDKKQSYVVVANHQSQFDIFVLYGFLGVDFKWILKQELRQIPGLGIGCEKVGHIFIDRSNHEAAVRSINAAREKIVNGTSVIFFPEGTRSNDGKMRDFKKGAFKMALDLGLPVLPVTIIGTKDILPNNTLDLFPGKALLNIHEPVPVTGYSEENIDELMKKVRDVMVEDVNSHYFPEMKN